MVAFAKDIEYILAMQYATEHKQVQDSINIALRQTRGRNAKRESFTGRYAERSSTYTKLGQAKQGIYVIYLI